MTKQEEVLNDSRYRPIHQYGFAGLIDKMGSDSDIAEAARVSYGAGTKIVSDDRNLIRYLTRHTHTSPIEMGEVKFHLKLPLFIMAQLVRHRTANLNQYSSRYSLLSDEFYIPSAEYIAPQSTTNKQGRAGNISEHDKMLLSSLMTTASRNAYEMYQILLGAEEFPDISDIISEESREYGLSPEYPGLARELSRAILPVNNYTECYWKCDLHNFFHMCRLRMDPHAQREIVDFATVMYELVKPYFPLTCEAFEDYRLNAVTLSAMDLRALQDMLQGTFVADPTYYRMSKREYTEFVTRFVPTDRHLSS